MSNQNEVEGDQWIPPSQKKNTHLPPPNPYSECCPNSYLTPSFLPRKIPHFCWDPSIPNHFRREIHLHPWLQFSIQPFDSKSTMLCLYHYFINLCITKFLDEQAIHNHLHNLTRMEQAVTTIECTIPNGMLTKICQLQLVELIEG